MKIKLALFLCLLFFLPQPVFAVIADFQVNGLIQSSDGKVMPGSTVVFMDKNGHEISSSTTGVDGRYQSLVPEGEYKVIVKAPAESKMDDIVFVGQIINANTSRDFTFNTGKTISPVLQKEATVKNFALNKTLIIIALAFVTIIFFGFIILRILRLDKKEEEKIM